MSDLIVLHPSDDVAVVLRASGLSPGEAFEAGGRSGTVHSKVPRGHKLALRDLAAGAEIRKYGLPIAVATQAIRAGEHVHSHNAAMPPFAEAEGEATAAPVAASVDWDSEPGTFHNGGATTHENISNFQILKRATLLMIRVVGIPHCFGRVLLVVRRLGSSSDQQRSKNARTAAGESPNEAK